MGQMQLMIDVYKRQVEVHNKVWSILEGNVGEAYDLDEESISKIKEKYY